MCLKTSDCWKICMIFDRVMIWMQGDLKSLAFLNSKFMKEEREKANMTDENPWTFINKRNLSMLKLGDGFFQMDAFPSHSSQQNLKEEMNSTGLGRALRSLNSISLFIFISIMKRLINYSFFSRSASRGKRAIKAFM